MSNKEFILCRACLTEQDFFNYYIFQDISPDDYWFCTSVQIHSKDRLSKALCDKCYHLLTSLSQFKQTCIQSQETLRRNLLCTASDSNIERPIKKEENKCFEDDKLADCRLDDFDTLDEKVQVKIEDAPVDDDLLDDFCPITETTKSGKKRSKIKVKLKSNERSKQYSESKFPNSFNFSCNICNKKFKHLERLNAHKGTHEGKFLKIECTTCNKVFSTWSGLQRHNNSEHEQIKLDSLMCPVCGKISKSKQTLRMHLKTHGDRRMEMCDVCGKGFISIINLKEHLNIHKKHRERSYTCEQCGKKYFTKTVLLTHMKRRHSNQRYICQICNYPFTDKYNLSKHLRRHQDNKLYRCDICSKQLSTLSTLAEHKRTHSGERPYCCSTCSKCFATRRRLGEHLRTHTGDKPHKCGICAQKFTQRGTLTRHMKIHSKMITVEPV